MLINNDICIALNQYNKECFSCFNLALHLRCLLLSFRSVVLWNFLLLDLLSFSCCKEIMVSNFVVLAIFLFLGLLCTV
jgi:hypothetical protein